MTLTTKQIQTLFERFEQQDPAPDTELNYHSSFELLVAVVLSAQSTDAGVNKVTARLYPVANTPESLLALGQEGLEGYTKTIGLYRAKSKNILTLCRQLLERHQGQVPGTREELEALAGVGRKTANVILNTLYQAPVVAVDTHVFRVSQRIGLASGKNVQQVEAQLEKTIPVHHRKNANHWLVLHGRYVCQARKPKCSECFIRDLCEYPLKT